MSNSRVVYKYPLVGSIQMPKDAKILTVHMQSGIPCIWAEVSPAGPDEIRHFLIVPTGGRIPPIKSGSASRAKHIGTFFESSGHDRLGNNAGGRENFLVWHVYETEDGNCEI